MTLDGSAGQLCVTCGQMNPGTLAKKNLKIKISKLKREIFGRTTRLYVFLDIALWGREEIIAAGPSCTAVAVNNAPLYNATFTYQKKRQKTTHTADKKSQQTKRFLLSLSLSLSSLSRHLHRPKDLTPRFCTQISPSFCLKLSLLSEN